MKSKHCEAPHYTIDCPNILYEGFSTVSMFCFNYADCQCYSALCSETVQGAGGTATCEPLAFRVEPLVNHWLLECSHL
jgi:hypothetical protein